MLRSAVESKANWRRDEKFLLIASVYARIESARFTSVSVWSTVDWSSCTHWSSTSVKRTRRNHHFISINEHNEFYRFLLLWPLLFIQSTSTRNKTKMWDISFYFTWRRHRYYHRHRRPMTDDHQRSYLSISLDFSRSVRNFYRFLLFSTSSPFRWLKMFAV